MARQIITFKQKGDFRKTQNFLTHNLRSDYKKVLDECGIRGVEALKAATPVDTGKTADSWGYEIESDKSGIRLIWTNSNINDGVPIAVILQYGHGTGWGGFFEGTDYINPALRPVFDEIGETIWKEVMKS